MILKYIESMSKVVICIFIEVGGKLDRFINFLLVRL